jgi:fumarate hydratase subunit beta
VLFLLQLSTPVSQQQIDRLQVFDHISISGKIFAGRDAALPKLAALFREQKLADAKIDLGGSVVFHTAVSVAGIGPTSSNKVDIEGTIPVLSRAGVKIHLGKGSLAPETVKALAENGSVYAVTPPVTALLTAKMLTKRVVAFPEEGMEALYEIEVTDMPAIIAIAHGRSIFEREISR